MPSLRHELTGATASQVQLADGLIATARDRRKPGGHATVRKVSQTGNGDGQSPAGTMQHRRMSAIERRSRDRQATRAFGGRSGTATTALAADVRRKGIAVDGWASGVRMTTLGGSAVHTTHAAHAEQLA